MTKIGAPERLIVNGRRLDGRAAEEFRPITVAVGPLTRANGSGYFAFGDTVALAGVWGPRSFHPKALQDPQRAIVKVRYAMAPFSTKERTRPGVSRRSTEISKVISDAFASVIFAEEYPRTGIEIFIEILQADASTRCAGINATSLALADAGIPVRDLIASCSVGRVDGTLVRDIAGVEDNFGEVDVALATIAKEDKIVLLQADGIITRQEFEKLLELGKTGCWQICDTLRAKLHEKWATIPTEVA